MALCISRSHVQLLSNSYQITFQTGILCINSTPLTPATKPALRSRLKQIEWPKNCHSNAHVGVTASGLRTPSGTIGDHYTASRGAREEDIESADRRQTGRAHRTGRWHMFCRAEEGDCPSATAKMIDLFSNATLPDPTGWGSSSSGPASFFNSSGYGNHTNRLYYTFPGFEYPTTAETAVKILVTALVFLIALIGNATVIGVVLITKTMWTPTNFYIMNLAVADLLIALFCMWIQLVADQTANWIFGDFMCRFYTFILDSYHINKIQHGVFRITLGPSPPEGWISFRPSGDPTRGRAGTSGDTEYAVYQPDRGPDRLKAGGRSYPREDWDRG
ncbi:hypothetical protein Bbelb_017610 [Branchiostoma belcheri]|nr:hypothetical protein Bbelb_017610 [Branchiostoma belcheri]